MEEEKDTRPTESPYASEICAVYFQGKGPLYINRELLRQSEELFVAATEVDSFSSTPAGDVHLENITFDTGHVIIHYLVTNTYQCLRALGEVTEKKNASEFATALRVYIAAEKLSLNQLRDLAREELVRMGDKLEIFTLIEVMEESIPSFEVLPGITAYIESRLLSFSEEGYGLTSDRVLAEIGIPDTLSKVLLRSIVLMKASENSLAAEPIIQQVGAVRSELVLQHKVEAMKLAEAQAEERAAQALRIAEELAIAKEMEELRDLRCKRAIRGKFSSTQRRRLQKLLDNAAKRDEDKAAQKAKEDEAKLDKNKPTGGVESRISPEGSQEQTLYQSDDGEDTGSRLFSTKKATGNAQGSSNTAQTSGFGSFGHQSGQSDDGTEQSFYAGHPFTPTFSGSSSSWH